MPHDEMVYNLFSEKLEKGSDITFNDCLFVDPGMGGTGWAFFSLIDVTLGKSRMTAKTKEQLKPKQTGVIRISRNKRVDLGWQNHVAQITDAFVGVVSALEPEHIIIEQPNLWSGDSKSHASAISKNGEPGDLFKLSYLIGCMSDRIYTRTNKRTILVFPYQWKGQLPKDVVIKRIEENGIETPRDHEADAIGMGLAAQGLL